LFQNIQANQECLLVVVLSVIVIDFQLPLLANDTPFEYFVLTKVEASTSLSSIDNPSDSFFNSIFIRSFGFSIHSNKLEFLDI
jgi:hypothetical protein